MIRCCCCFSDASLEMCQDYFHSWVAAKTDQLLRTLQNSEEKNSFTPTAHVINSSRGLAFIWWWMSFIVILMCCGKIDQLLRTWRKEKQFYTTLVWWMSCLDAWESWSLIFYWHQTMCWWHVSPWAWGCSPGPQRWSRSSGGRSSWWARPGSPGGCRPRWSAGWGQSLSCSRTRRDPAIMKSANRNNKMAFGDFETIFFDILS